MSRINLENSRMENPLIATGLRYGITVLPDSNSTIDPDMGPILFIKGTASRTLTLPAASAANRGLAFIVVNSAAFTVVINNAAAAAVGTVPASVSATTIVACIADSPSSTLGVGGWIGGL